MARTEVHIFTFLRVLGAGLLAIGMLGCAGGSVAGAVGVLLLVTGLWSCSESHEKECHGTIEVGCVDGKLQELCCPEGVACNYGLGVVECGNETCVSEPAQCPKPPPPVCDGYLETACQDNQPVQLCCPAGYACNYGMGTYLCGDGSCVNFYEDESCAVTEDSCHGPTYQSCVFGRVMTVCCRVGTDCYDDEFNDCGNGTCVYVSQSCPETP